MARQWVKEALHKDFLSQVAAKTTVWVKDNKENALIGSILFVAIIVFIPFIISHQNKLDNEVMILVSQGEMLSAQGQYNQAISFLDNALSKNRNKTNPLAYYYKANTLYNIGRYQEAIDTYNLFLSKYEKNILTPEIKIGLAKAYEQIGDYNKSINIYNEFIKNYSEHPFMPDVFQSLGRCYELAGFRDEAIRVYQQVSALYLQTLWKEMADDRLKDLGVQVSAPPVGVGNTNNNFE